MWLGRLFLLASCFLGLLPLLLFAGFLDLLLLSRLLNLLLASLLLLAAGFLYLLTARIAALAWLIRTAGVFPGLLTARWLDL